VKKREAENEAEGKAKPAHNLVKLLSLELFVKPKQLRKNPAQCSENAGENKAEMC
jgi:hypothetical protein